MCDIPRRQGGNRRNHRARQLLGVPRSDSRPAGSLLMIASIPSATLLGIRGHPVLVEAQVSNGLLGSAVIGLPDADCCEARDRVRAALLFSGLPWLLRRATFNLAPSEEALHTPHSPPSLGDEPGPVTGRSGVYPGGTCTRWSGPVVRTQHRPTVACTSLAGTLARLQTRRTRRLARARRYALDDHHDQQ
jgi:hypothetical protein